MIYSYNPINDTIPGMEARRTIALTVCTLVIIVSFAAIMGLIVFGGMVEQKKVLIYASIALGPVAMIAVMMGYAAWWLTMFFLSLFSSNEPKPGETQDIRDGWNKK